MSQVLQYGDGPRVIYEQLKDEILTGALAPGDQVKIQSVADKLGVSIVPVREALRMLASDGFIDIRPRRSPVVSRIELADILEINLIRQALEPLALAAAIDAHTGESLEKCRELIARDEVTEDRWQKVALNREFHLALVEPSGQARVLRLIEDQYDGISRFAQFLVVGSSVFQGTPHDEHTQILKAVERRDTDAAVDLMKYHLAASTGRVRTELARREK